MFGRTAVLGIKLMPGQAVLLKNKQFKPTQPFLTSENYLVFLDTVNQTIMCATHTMVTGGKSPQTLRSLEVYDLGDSTYIFKRKMTIPAYIPSDTAYIRYVRRAYRR